MTREEAAEEILRDDPYVMCKTCMGYGFIRASHRSPALNCTACFTVGRIVRRRYIQACTLLETYPREFTRAVDEES